MVYDANGENTVSGPQPQLANGTYLVQVVGDSQQEDGTWVTSTSNSWSKTVDVPQVTASDMKAYIWGQLPNGEWSSYATAGGTEHRILNYRSLVNEDTAIGGKTLKEFVNASGSTTAGDLTTNGPIAVTQQNIVNYPSGINSVGVVDITIRFTGTVTGTSVVKPYWRTNDANGVAQWTALSDIDVSNNGTFSASRTVTVSQALNTMIEIRVLSDDGSGNVILKATHNVVPSVESPRNNEVVGSETTSATGEGTGSCLLYTSPSPRD